MKRDVEVSSYLLDTWWAQYLACQAEEADRSLASEHSRESFICPWNKQNHADPAKKKEGMEEKSVVFCLQVLYPDGIIGYHSFGMGGEKVRSYKLPKSHFPKWLSDFSPIL